PREYGPSSRRARYRRRAATPAARAGTGPDAAELTGGPGAGYRHRCGRIRRQRWGGGTAMAASKNFPVFDCDSHVVEPPAVWDEYVPARQRAWVKSQFCFHTDSDLLMINGHVVPAARERSNAAEVGWARWSKGEVGRYTPGTEEWQARFGGLLGCRGPHAGRTGID